MSTADLHTSTGAYVLHALAPAERTEFERHLAACGACAQEVAELAATTARLGLAVAVPAPARMREQVLQRIRTVRQEPPEVPSRGRLRTWARALPRLSLAACLAAAAAFGGIAVWQHESAEDARSQARQPRRRGEEWGAVRPARHAEVGAAELADGARGTVIVSRAQDRAAFVAAGLPELPDGKVYQLWFNDGDVMRPAGEFSGSGGERVVLLDGRIDGASGMGLTVEPAGGSPRPTTEPVGVMAFPA
ncbi:anti-sigma factor domain-containing protein [Streptomyces sp. N35]|uniref:anti-sigma factor n=1 Tax=Streptomyces sp. N35 TaxID=2795730 RepID=UPI0018F608A8|nr:anti-sigma factor [Streptomyces sp. N35]